CITTARDGNLRLRIPDGAEEVNRGVKQFPCVGIGDVGCVILEEEEEPRPGHNEAVEPGISFVVMEETDMGRIIRHRGDDMSLTLWTSPRHGLRSGQNGMNT